MPSKNRLRPSATVGPWFAQALKRRGVPIRHPEQAPLVCAEIYEAWYLAGRPLHELTGDTAANIARDAFLAEGGKLIRAASAAVRP